MLTLRFFNFLFNFLILSASAFAQTGTIAGMILDAETSEPLIGATILVENISGAGAITDLDGRYKITDVDEGTHTLRISYVSYKTKTISDVVVTAGKITPLDLVMESELKDIFGDSAQVIITAKAGQENINAVLAIQQKGIAISDVISRDVIQRTPDRSTDGVLKRMSGTTITDGKFVVIRGLSDRYNIALVNGNLLPSTEPDRKTFAFDLFPSSLLDNLFIYKTAQPDMPGDFAGGIISLNTRDIPNESFIQVTVGTGYNTVSTFNDYYTYVHGEKDWLGMDDGTLALPENFPKDRSDFLDLTDEESADLGKEFSPWGANSEASSPLDQSYQLSGGWVRPMKDNREIGLIGALTYNNTRQLSVIERKDYDNEVTPLYEYTDDQYRHNVLWGGLLNLAFKASENHKLSLKNSYSVNATDLTTLRGGSNFSKAVFIRNEYYDFSSNQLFSSTLNGDHFLPQSKIKAHWAIGLNTLVRDQPNYRTVNYFTPDLTSDTVFYASVSSFAAPDNMGIFYSYMKEKGYTGALDLTYPFQLSNIPQSIKVGAFYQSKERQFNARNMGVVVSNDIYTNPDYYSILSTPVGELLTAENFSDSLFYLDEITNPSDSYDAEQSNKALYAMLDNKIGKLRIVWGARAEFFNQILQSFFYSASSTPDPLYINTAETDTVGLPFDLLPSVNMTYALTTKTNLRLSGYKTVARPELRELAPFGFYDIETNSSVVGNPFFACNGHL